MTQQLSRSSFEAWLDRYGRAWEARDAEAAAELFAEDAEYFWTPIQEPQRGRREIAEAWSAATSRQRNITFRFEILALTGTTGIAHWHTSLVRIATNESIEIDGILLAELDSGEKCRIFREWWHSTESSGASPRQE